VAPDDIKPFSIYDDEEPPVPKIPVPPPSPESRPLQMPSGVSGRSSGQDLGLSLEIEDVASDDERMRQKIMESLGTTPPLPTAPVYPVKSETREAAPFLHGVDTGPLEERSKDLVRKRRDEGKIHDRRKTASIFDRPIEPDRPILAGKKRWHPFAYSWRSFWFMAPALLAFALFYLYPTLEGFLVSLMRYHPIGGGVPVGVENYQRAMTDPVFWQTVVNATAFTFVSMVLSFWPPIFLAILLNEMRHGKAFFRVVFLLPFVIPAIPAANLWRWMYDSGFGVLNALLAYLPGSPQVGWLTDPRWALLSIVFMFIWKNTGWYLLLYYAALQTLPEERYEAAELDGAGVAHKLIHITLPHLRPIMGMLLILQVLNAFQVFTEVFVMTGGGPMRTTEVLGTYIYKTAFNEMDLGYASAMGMLMFAALFVFSLVRVARLRRTEV